MNEPTEKQKHPLAKLGLRVVIYLIVIAVLLYLKGRSEPAPINTPMPTIEGLPRDGSPGPLENQSQLDALYPQRTFLAWDAEKDAEGRQTVLVLLKLEGNLKDLQWNELKLRSKDSPADLSIPEPHPSMPRPAPGIVLIQFALPDNSPEYTGGLVWCWDRPFCELTTGRRWPRAELEKHLKENQSGAVDEPALPG